MNNDEIRMAVFVERFNELMNSFYLENDSSKIELVTAMFTKWLIKNKLNDPNGYAEVAKRLATLIDLELAWQTSYERSLSHAQEENPRTIINKTTEEILGEMRRALRGTEESHA